MSTRQSWVLGFCFIVGCSILAATFGPHALAQPRGEPVVERRYQMMRLRENSDNVLVLDTVTGRCWVSTPQILGVARWTDLGSPATQDKP